MALHTRGVDFTVAAVPVVSGEVNKLVVDIVEIIKGSGKTLLRRIKDFLGSVLSSWYAAKSEKFAGVYSKVAFSWRNSP